MDLTYLLVPYEKAAAAIEQLKSWGIETYARSYARSFTALNMKPVGEAKPQFTTAHANWLCLMGYKCGHYDGSLSDKKSLARAVTKDLGVRTEVRTVTRPAPITPSVMQRMPLVGGDQRGGGTAIGWSLLNQGRAGGSNIPRYQKAY